MTEQTPSALHLLARQRAWLVGIPLVIALIAGAFTAHHLSRLLAFDIRGVAVDATITSDRSIRRGGSDGTTHRFGYRFETADGALIQGITNVSPWFRARTSPGDIVTARYLPEAPEQVMIDRSNQVGGVALTGIPTLISLALSVWLLRRYTRRTLAMLRAGRHGPRRTAEVIGHKGARVVKGEQPLDFRVRWLDDTGAEGESFYHEGWVLNRHAPKGAQITLRIDPRTGAAFWERDLFER